MTVTPESLAKSGTESGLQRAVLQWAALNTPKYPCLKWLHHVMNSSVVGTSERDRFIRGARMKADGVKKGILDLSLLYPSCGYHGLMIELKKKGKLKTISPEQKEYIEYLNSVGYLAVVCDDLETVIKIIESYLHFETK